MKIVITVGLILLFPAVYAQNGNESAAERGAFGCAPLDLSQDHDDFTFNISTHFSNLQQAAVEINSEICAALNDPISNELPITELASFGLLAESEANTAFGGTGEQGGVATTMRAFAASLNRGEPFPTTMPDLEVFTRPGQIADEPVIYSVTVATATEQTVTDESNDTCIETSGATCSVLIRDLDHAIRPYKRSYQINVTNQNADLLTGMQADWNSFFENARSMTTVDLVLTSILEKDHMRQGFLVGPVKRQWFALHPNIILQYTEDVPKGDRFQAGLSIEWFGVNYWKDSVIGMPLGVSLTSVYSDREGLDSVGHGLTLHFDNRYAVGWTKHGSDDAFHISADLLSLFTEKENEFKKYKEKVLSLK